MSKRRLFYFYIMAMIIYIMPTIQACSGDEPEPDPILPINPDTPTDSIPPIPSDSIPPTPTDSVPDTNQDTSPNGISTTINNWDIDGKDNGGTAQ